MRDIFYIIIYNLVLLAVIYRNFDYSHELQKNDYVSKTIQLSAKIRKITLLRSSENGMKKIRLFGFIFHVVVANFTLILALFVVLCSFVRLVKIIFNFQFIWFTTSFLGLSAVAIIGYSGVMHIFFSFVNWIYKRK